VNTGQIISGAGHTILIGWALIGNLFAATPKPFEVTQVTAVSTEEFNAIMAAQRPPQAASDVAVPDAPEVSPDSPDLSSQTDPATEQAQPETTENTPPDAAPDVAELTPLPEAEVEDTSPELQQPSEDVAALLPETSERPKQRPVERVAPEQVDPPEPDTAIDDVVREEVVPDEAAEVPQEETEATAPEAAATEIVTEAEQMAAAAVTRSLRPKTRPKAPKPAEEPAQPSAIEAALQAAQDNVTDTEPASRPTPSGPPLTGGEKDALRVAVQQCWNVGSLSTEALNTTVVVAVDMSEDSRPVPGSIRMIGSSGGSDTAARQAFETARRAIIRCGARGFSLPVEKYAHWQTIEMTFNPEKMRIK